MNSHILHRNNVKIIGNGSQPMQQYSNLKGYAQDVLDICQALDLTNVVFMGYSVSSIIGILAAIKQPQRFEQLILIGPSPLSQRET